MIIILNHLAVPCQQCNLCSPKKTDSWQLWQVVNFPNENVRNIFICVTHIFCMFLSLKESDKQYYPYLKKKKKFKHAVTSKKSRRRKFTTCKVIHSLLFSYYSVHHRKSQKSDETPQKPSQKYETLRVVSFFLHFHSPSSSLPVTLHNSRIYPPEKLRI